MPRTAAPSQSRARARILQTASDLFYQHGLRAVGVDTVVEKSGVAKMTLYNHFPSKDALIAAVLAKRGQDWLALLRTQVEASPPRERLAASFDALESLFKAPGFRGCTFINTALETADRDHPTSRACLDHKKKTRDLLIEWATLTGAADPPALADQVFLLFEGATVAAAMWGLAEPARRAKQAALVLIENSRKL